MRVAITGGLGFIGSHFVESALVAGYEVLVIDKLTYAGNVENLAGVPSQNYQLSILDISEKNLLFSALESFKPDILVNFAAESHVDRSISNPQPFYTSNIIGATNCYEAARVGIIGRVIQISTDEVYGSISTGSWDENSPLLPRSPYSASKASAELIGLSYISTFDINLQITRCANNYGSRQGVEKFIPNSILASLNGSKIPVYGTGLNRREWIHVSDHISALMTIIGTQNPKSNVYNIGGQEYPNIEVAKMIIALNNQKDELMEFVEDRRGHDFRYSVNSSRFEKEFNWQMKYSLSEGLLETVEWYRESQSWVASSLKRNLQ